MDVGQGEVVKLPPDVRDAWWDGTTRAVAVHGRRHGHRPGRVMAHYLSNHVAVAYGDIFEEMVALSQALGFRIRILKDA